MELLCEEVTATDTASLSDQEREAPARQQQILHFLDVKEIHGYNPGGCHRVNAYFPKSSSIDDDREGSGAVVEDDRGPWWANDPELIEIRRRTVEEFDRELDQREPGPANAPDPVVADILGGASLRDWPHARDDLERARAR